MTENNGLDKETNTTKFTLFFFLILGCVNIIDQYTTALPNNLQSSIAAEFLSFYSVVEQDAILAMGSAFFSIGAYFVFFLQYFSDRWGRKMLLIITTFGTALALIGILLSTSYMMYILLALFLSFFFRSDIWMIYINESVEGKKRAKYTFAILLIGLMGSLLMGVNRLIFVGSGNPIGWRGMTLFPIFFAIIISIIITFKLKETPQYEQMKKLKESKQKKSFSTNISDVFKIEERKAYLAIVLISFIFNFATITGYTLMEKYVSDTGNITQAEYTIALGLTLLSVFIAFLGNSFLLDKVGRRTMIYVYSVILPISMILSILAALHPTMALPLFTIFTLITNIAFYGIGITLRIITLEYLPTEHRGTGLGLRGLIFAIGGTTGLLFGSMLILVLELGFTMILLTLLVFIIIPLGMKYLKETKDVELSQIK